MKTRNNACIFLLSFAGNPVIELLILQSNVPRLMAWFFPEILTTESHRCPHLPPACRLLLLWTLCCKGKAVFHQTSHCLGRWLVTMLTFSLGCWGLRFNYRSKRSKATGSTHQSKLLDSNCYLKDLGPCVFFNFFNMYQKCAAGFFMKYLKI